jgi:hypothetical protein
VYRTLDAGRILVTVERLQQRIRERFPQAGLNKVCAEVAQVARETEDRCHWIERPHLLLRGGVVVALLLLVLSLLGVALAFAEFEGRITFPEFVQVLEAGLNDLVLVGAAIFFLVTLETRLKRSRALQGLHELRALAHVVDMHQLTKDPVRLRLRGADTASSPHRPLTPFELTRYLDYCAELLSLVGKIAALYAQHLNDSVVLSAVTEIEQLTNGLSLKIWQKVESVDGGGSKGAAREPGQG